MRKAACHSDGVDSLNPRRWRGGQLHHHGDGVCWLFTLLWMDSWCHELVVCKKWYKNNLKMRLTSLLFDPPRRAPHHWVTLLWSTSRCVYFIRPNTLLLCIFLFCISLLYHADPQVEVQIRILLKDKYRKSCQKCKHRQSHFDFLNNAYWVSLF